MACIAPPCWASGAARNSRGQRISTMGASCVVGAENDTAFWQRDWHSTCCTRQMPPIRVSVDSLSRILPGDVLVFLWFPPPEMLQCPEWPGLGFILRVFRRGEFFWKKRARDHSLARGNTWRNVVREAHTGLMSRSVRPSVRYTKTHRFLT
jgi:hypothetical protein